MLSTRWCLLRKETVNYQWKVWGSDEGGGLLTELQVLHCWRERNSRYFVVGSTACGCLDQMERRFVLVLCFLSQRDDFPVSQLSNVHRALSYPPTSPPPRRQDDHPPTRLLQIWTHWKGEFGGSFSFSVQDKIPTLKLVLLVELLLHGTKTRFQFPSLFLGQHMKMGL